MSDVRPSILSDPCYDEIREIRPEPSPEYEHKKERRPGKCVVCKENKAEYHQCREKEEIECGCCSECKCPLK